jgi:hypothetical protein
LVVGRFQIMTLLQAARAYVLGLPLESAHSWGLNRSIFIAAAKRGFKGGSGGSESGRKGGGTSKKSDVYYLGDDMAYKTEKDGVLLFTIGGKVQTKEEFDKRVRSRFGSVYQEAWKEALAYVKGFDKETLLSTEGFFRVVYRPVRDELAEKWTEASGSSADTRQPNQR